MHQQEKLLADLTAKRDSVAGQARQIQASNHNDETELKGIDERIELLRDRMNNAKTSKEHGAMLAEINTLKEQRSGIEERVLERMGKLEELTSGSASLDADQAQRQKVRDIAAADRAARADEIKDRVAELEKQRDTVRKEVPAAALSLYTSALERGVEEIMAPIEEQDRRSMEYTCGSCYTHLPIEKVSVLMQKGDITTCPACDVLLYLAEETREALGSAKPNARSRAVTID